MYINASRATNASLTKGSSLFVRVGVSRSRSRCRLRRIVKYVDSTTGRCTSELMPGVVGVVGVWAYGDVRQSICLCLCLCLCFCLSLRLVLWLCLFGRCGVSHWYLVAGSQMVVTRIES